VSHSSVDSSEAWGGTTVAIGYHSSKGVSAILLDHERATTVTLATVCTLSIAAHLASHQRVPIGSALGSGVLQDSHGGLLQHITTTALETCGAPT